MKDLMNVLFYNKNKAIQIMKDNNVMDISFYDEEGNNYLEEKPFITIEDNSDDFEVIGIRIKDNDLVFILEGQWEIKSDICTICSANHVYEAIETYFFCFCTLHSKLHALNTALINEFQKLVPHNTELSTNKNVYPAYDISPLNNRGITKMSISMIKNNSCIEFFDDISKKFYNMNDFAETDLLDILYYFSRVKYKLEHQ